MRGKIVALALVFMLLAGAAAAQENDLVQARDIYFGENATPEGAIGAVFFWGFSDPDAPQPECMGTDTLLIEFARPGVTGGEGFLRLFAVEGDALFFECRGDDPECIDYQPSDMGGTDMFVTLDEPLESGASYYLRMEAGTVLCGGVSNSAADTKGQQHMLVGDFGVDEMGMPEEYFVGVPAALPVVVGGMARAVLEVDGEMLSLDASQTDRDAVLTVTPLRPGTSEISLSFYDREGNYAGGLIVPVEAA